MQTHSGTRPEKDHEPTKREPLRVPPALPDLVDPRTPGAGAQPEHGPDEVAPGRTPTEAPGSRPREVHPPKPGPVVPQGPEPIPPRPREPKRERPKTEDQE